MKTPNGTVFVSYKINNGVLDAKIKVPKNTKAVFKYLQENNNEDITAKALADAFWPGPLTMILPKSEIVPQAVCGKLSTVAVRMPQNEIAKAII